MSCSRQLGSKIVSAYVVWQYTYTYLTLLLGLNLRLLIASACKIGAGAIEMAAHAMSGIQLKKIC